MGNIPLSLPGLDIVNLLNDLEYILGEDLLNGALRLFKHHSPDTCKDNDREKECKCAMLDTCSRIKEIPVASAAAKGTGTYRGRSVHFKSQSAFFRKFF